MLWNWGVKDNYIKVFFIILMSKFIKIMLFYLFLFIIKDLCINVGLM